MNLHGLAATRPSTWRVCQFRHSRRIRRPVNGTAKLRNCDGDAVLLSIYLLPAGSQAPRHLPHSFAQDGLPAGHRPISPTAKPTAHLYNATGSAASFRTVRFSHRRSPTKTPSPNPLPPTLLYTIASQPACWRCGCRTRPVMAAARAPRRQLYVSTPPNGCEFSRWLPDGARAGLRPDSKNRH